MTLVDRMRAMRDASDGDARAWDALTLLAEQMEAAGRARDDPIRDIFGLLGDRWTMLILLALNAGEWRHATLRRIVGTLSIEGAISQRVLTQKLRALERNGFVRRRASDDVPPRVEYRLTDSGDSLLLQATALLDWVRAHRTRIEADRRAFGASRDSA